MEFNLRKARKLESKINLYLEKEALETEVSVRTLGTAALASKLVVSARKEALISLRSRLSLVDLRYLVRREIEKKNEDCGINALLNAKVLTQIKLNQYGEIATTPALTSTELGDHLKAHKTLLESGAVESDRWGSTKVEPKTTFKVPVLSKDDLKRFTDLIGDLKRRLEQIDDDLSVKNMTAKIVLSKDSTELLESHRLL